MRPNLSLETIAGALAVLGTGVIMAACGGDPKTPVNANEVNGATEKAAGDGANHCGAGKDHKAGQAGCAAAAGDAKPGDTSAAGGAAATATPAATTPAATTPAASTPADTKPADAKPADAKAATGTPAPASTTGKKPAAPAAPGTPAKKGGSGSCGAGTCSAKK